MKSTPAAAALLLKLLGALLLMLHAMVSARAADLPLQTGAWLEIPESRLRDVAPRSPGGDVSKVIDAWSGAAFDPRRELLLVWGGGHSDYAGNELYAFDLQTLVWERLTNPSVADDARTANYADGQPRARHTYNYIEYVPAWDRLASFGGSGPWPRGGGEFTREISEFDYETRVWLSGGRPAVPAGGSIIAALARLDVLTGDVYFVPGGKGSSLLRLDPRTQRWHDGWGRAYVTAHATGAIDPERRLLVVVGKGTADAARQAWKWDLTVPSAPVDLRDLTKGDVAVERAMAPGFAFHGPTGRFVGWIGGTDLLTLDPDTWQWTRVRAAPGSANPGAPSPRGTYGRFQYIPRLDAFVLINDVDQNVFLVRPDFGERDDGPEPTTTHLSLRADPERIAADGIPTLSWTADGADQCEAFGNWRGPRAPRGTAAVSFGGLRGRFGLRCDGIGGPAEATIVVTRISRPSVSLAARPASIVRGGTTTLTWKATAQSRCAARGGWHGPRAERGSEVIRGLHAGTSFELQCVGEGGAGNAKVDVGLMSTEPVDARLEGDTGQGGFGNSGGLGNGLLAVLALLAAASRGRWLPLS